MARPPAESRRFDLWRPLVALAAFLACVALPLAVLAAAVVWMVGCASPVRAVEDTGRSLWSSLASPGNAPSYAILGILASLLVVAAVGTVIASYFLPIIPRKMAGVCLVMAVGLWALQWALDAYLGLIVLLTVIVAVIVAAPLVAGWVRRSIQKYGEEFAKVEPRAGVAIQAAVNPKVLKTRKTQLLRYEAMAGRVAPRQEGT